MAGTFNSGKKNIQIQELHKKYIWTYKEHIAEESYIYISIYHLEDSVYIVHDYYSNDNFFSAKYENGPAGGETDEDRAAPVLGLHRKHHLQLPD